MTPEEEAQLRSSIGGIAGDAGGFSLPSGLSGLASQGPAATLHGAPYEDTMVNRLRATIGRTLDSNNPALVGGISGATGIPPMALSAAGNAIAPAALPAPAAPAKPGPQELKPMYTPQVDVQPVAPLALTQPQVGRSFGGGGGTPAGPSARSTYLDSARKGIGLIGEEANRTARLGVAEADRVEGVSGLEEQHAQRIQEMADIQRKADDDAQASATAFIDQNKRMADEISQMKVQPSKLWHEKGAGDKMAFGVAAALSGLASGLSGKPDQFIATWEHAIDRDIAAQEKNIDNAKSGLAARQSIFGQFLQQTGDRRLAQSATRNLMLQGLTQQIKAQSDRLGIPEVAAKADLLVNGVQQKAQNAQTGFDQGIAQWQAAQAAAAASAQAAARKEAYEREIKTIELGQKQDELNIKRIEAEGKNSDKTDQKVAELSKALGDDKMAKGRAAVEALATQVAKTPEGDQIAGRKWTDKALLALPGGSRLVSNQANVNIQNEKDLDLAYQQMITGSGGSDEQMQRIYEAAKGAGTSAEFANQVNKLRDYYVMREKAARAGAGPEASAQYDKNRGLLDTKMPDGVKITAPAVTATDNPWTRKK